MKQKYILLGLFIQLLAACSETNMENVELALKEEVQITATIGKHNPESRVVFEEGESMTLANWEIGDVITLFTEEQSNLHYKAAVNEDNPDVSVRFVSATDEVLKNTEGQKVVACYPISDDVVSEIGLPVTNVFDYNGSVVNGYCPFLYGKGIIQGERLDLNFNHLFAYLKLVVNKEALPFNVEDKTIDLITLSVSGDEPLSVLEGTFDLQAQSPVYSKTANEININYSFDLSSGDLSLYVPVLPQTDENNKMLFLLQNVKSDGSKEILYRMEPNIPWEGIKQGHVYITKIPGNSYNSNLMEGTVSDITDVSATINVMLTDNYYYEPPYYYKISVIDVSTGLPVDVSEVKVVDEKTFKCTAEGLTPGSVYIAYMSITFTHNDAMVYDETVTNSVIFRTLE